MRKSDLETLTASIAARKPIAVVTSLSDGSQRLYRKGEAAPSPLAEALSEGFRTDRSKVVPGETGEVFINIYNPALRMVIVGAVHISQALIPMARQVGYDVVVVDPRTAFASGERFQGVRLDARWPDEALPEIALDARTAFIALTHDPKIDDPALKLAIASDCFYIGALGSSRTNAKRRERLSATGLPEVVLNRIHAPVGLDIGAIGAPEIAVSILAEVTAALRGKDKPRS